MNLETNFTSPKATPNRLQYMFTAIGGAIILLLSLLAGFIYSQINTPPVVQNKEENTQTSQPPGNDTFEYLNPTEAAKVQPVN